MKKIFLLLLVSALLLCSCKKESRVFEFQDGGGTYNCEISYLGDEFSAKITLAPLENGERSRAEIVYTSPESISGYRVKRVGDKYYAVVSELEIPVTSRSLPQLSYTEALFSLRDEDITEIETDSDGNSVVKVSCGDYRAPAVATFTPDGKILSLALPSVDFSITFIND